RKTACAKRSRPGLVRRVVQKSVIGSRLLADVPRHRAVRLENSDDAASVRILIDPEVRRLPAVLDDLGQGPFGFAPASEARKSLHFEGHVASPILVRVQVRRT